MNKQQRKELSDLMGVLPNSTEDIIALSVDEDARIALADKYDDLSSKCREMANEEEEKYDNMSDGLRNSERGEAMQNAAQVLESAADDLDQIINYIRDGYPESGKEEDIIQWAESIEDDYDTIASEVNDL